METVRFLKFSTWALPPIKEKVVAVGYQNPDLRWNQKTRVKGACWPYKMGKQVGWTICSPLDVEISPLEEVQVSASEEELEEIGSLLHIDFWVKRGSTYIGVKPDGWFRMHQARVNGFWRNLFVPNGEGTLEWALGFGVEIPEEYVILFQPIEGQENFIVHPGLLQSKDLQMLNQSGMGLSLAFEPKKKSLIRRGDPLAKLLVFHKSALNLQEEIVEEVIEHEPLEII